MCVLLPVSSETTLPSFAAVPCPFSMVLSTAVMLIQRTAVLSLPCSSPEQMMAQR